MVKAFEEVVRELEKYDVIVYRKVTETNTDVIDRELKDLASKDMLTLEGVKSTFGKFTRRFGVCGSRAFCQCPDRADCGEESPCRFV